MGATAAIVLTSIGVISLISLLIKLFKWIVVYRKQLEFLDRLPQRPRHWLFGHLHTHPGFSADLEPYWREHAQQFPRLYVEWYGPLDPHVVVHHPDTVRTILKTAARRCCVVQPIFAHQGFCVHEALAHLEPKSWLYLYMKPWLGDGLLLSTGRKWARNRRLLTSAFHFDILKTYLHVNNSCANIFLDNISKHCHKKETFELYNYVSLMTLDFILKCAYSYDVNCQTEGSENEYIQAVFRLCHIIMDRALKPWLSNDVINNIFGHGREERRLLNIVNKVATSAIEERKQKLKYTDVSQKKYIDFLDLLLTAKDSDGQGIDDTNMRDEVNTFLFEGHDTTASAITWSLFLLAQHPEYQRRCQREIDDVLQGRQDLEWDDFSRFPFTTMCIKEAMRFSATVPLIARELTEDMTIDGYELPKGIAVDIRIWNVHHNPHVWKDDMVFNPERFSDEGISQMDPFAYVPFSAGPRNCIGQNLAMHELKSVLVKSLHRYTWYVDASKSTRMIPALVQKATDGIWVGVTPRHVTNNV